MGASVKSDFKRSLCQVFDLGPGEPSVDDSQRGTAQIGGSGQVSRRDRQSFRNTNNG